MWLLANLCQAADSRLVCIDTWGGAEQYTEADSRARSSPSQRRSLSALTPKAPKLMQGLYDVAGLGLGSACTQRPQCREAF